MKTHEDGDNVAIYFNSLSEHLGQFHDKDIEILAEEIDFNPMFYCVKSYAELLTKMNYDEAFVKTYNKIKADIYLPSKKSVATFKQYRDSGNHFNFQRYLDGRPCVWKSKKIEDNGGKTSRTVPVLFNLGEHKDVTQRQMSFKALACAEMVKAIQTQGKNAEVYAVKYTGEPTRERFELTIVTKIKGGAEPLVIPRLLAALSPYFFRCYYIGAQKDYIRYKDFTPQQHTNRFRSGHGWSKEINDDFPRYRKLLAKLGLTGLENAIVIDTLEVYDKYSLDEFRAKHGITLH